MASINMFKKTSIILFSLIFFTAIGSAQELIQYKQIDTTKLFIEIHYPEDVDKSKDYPAIVFFFGGGWVGGDRAHFLHQAEYFSQRGLICFLVDYRIKKKHGTTPFESLKDAKSAMRYIRKNADQFGIDPDKIIGSGGSAGGHLAAACALIDGYNEASDDTTISTDPNALVLFNPVIDNGPAGYGYERIGDQYKEFSPLHNIKKGAPPTAILIGTKDRLIPVETVKYYKAAMEKVGSRCDLFLYEDQEHGFFNLGKGYFKITVLEADTFLQSLGYLNKEPFVDIDKIISEAE